MELFSYSRLSKYVDCPGAFYRRYPQAAKEPPVEPLVMGKGVHSVIETAMRLQRTDREFFEALTKLVIDNAPLELDPEEVLELSHQEVVLKEFRAENHIEEHVELPLSDDPFAPFIHGYVDLWRNGQPYVEIVDWKTNRIFYEPRDTYQLGLYAWFIHQKTGLPVQGKLVFLRGGYSPEQEFSRDDMEAAREWALTTALDIQDRLCRVNQGESREKLFPATPGDACRYCGFALECVDGHLPPVPGEVRTAQEAQHVGAEIFRLEAAVNQMKGMLKQYVELCGPIVVGGRRFQTSPSRWWKWDGRSMKEAIAKIIDQGGDPYELVTLGATQLKKLGWDDSTIRSLGAREQVKWTFKDVSVRN